MDTEALYEDRAHGLLATAFDDDVPVLNLVPAAVGGFRRHRRRTRVLGTAGGVVALTGVVAAGAVVTFGGRPAVGTTAQSAPAQKKAADVDKCQVPDAVVKQAGWDAAMVRTVTGNCETNVGLIERAIPGAQVTPASMNPRDTPQIGGRLVNPGPEGLRYYPVIAYNVTLNGRTAALSLDASSPSGAFSPCGSFCVKDTTLFGGMHAQEYSGPDGSAAKDQIDEVVAFPNDKEVLDISVTYPPATRPVFDFHSFSHSAAFVKIVTGSTDLLRGTKYAGGDYIPVG